MAWQFAGRLLVVVHGPRDPSNLEWQRMLTDEAAHGVVSDGRTLIVSYGGGPNGEQRAMLGQQLGKNAGPTCIMTKSAIVRAITSVILFFNPRMKVVGLEDRGAAYAFLGLSAAERQNVETIRASLEAALGLQRSLSMPANPP